LHRTQYGQTALIVAASENQAECVRSLLELGADNNATDDVRAIWYFAVRAFAYMNLEDSLFFIHHAGCRALFTIIICFS
jgi:hypothetical protein